MNTGTVRLRIEPASVEVELARGESIGSALAGLGVELPCGGEGVCGACRVRVLTGSLPVTEADLSAFTPAELERGWRLACQARAEDALALECGQWEMEVLADDAGLSGSGRQGLGIAIDLGTTTIAAQMIDLATGRVLGVETGLNPQSAFGADVMSRIRAALEGADLTTPLRTALGAAITRLASERADEVAAVVLVGNTVMHHLFCGIDVEPLSRVPFETPHLQAQWFTPQELGWPLPASTTIRF